MKKSKMIDIHSKKELSNLPGSENDIKNSLVKDYVFSNISFPLTDRYWSVIDESFATIWNNKIGLGGYFYWDEIAKHVFEELKKEKMLMSYDRVEIITNLMLTYIEDTGGFME
jgi:hypothetical protein